MRLWMGSLNYINLDNGKQKLICAFKPTDKDNLGMFYAFIKHNCFLYRRNAGIYKRCLEKPGR